MIPHHLVLTIPPLLISSFYPMFQQGVRIPSHTDCTLGELLSEQWGIDPGYVKDRITTIFLNHRAIDSISTTIVRGGSTLALSGAMPGLVGATMRCGGHLAAMRGAMTHTKAESAGEVNCSWIRLKLFNLLLPELCPGFLARGILIDSTEWERFRKEHLEDLGEALSDMGAHSSSGFPVSFQSSSTRCGDSDHVLTVVLKG